MVLEQQPLPLSDWLQAGLPMWLIAVGALALASLLLGFIVASLLNGPGRAGDMTYRLLSGAAVDLVRISPRRVWALARLAIQESFRRRVLAGLGLFVVILAFAIWFLDANTNDPARLYLSFVLTAATYLVLLMVLFLSAFSLPNDIKNHTIYTVVTKPVRPSEIVLGRIVGFALVGTVMLAIMGLVSYWFVVRALNHTHDVDVRNGEIFGTSTVRGHHHQVSSSADGNLVTDVVQGHWHDVTTQGTGDNQRYGVGDSQGQFHARVPVYGKLTFRDRAGQLTTKGINVGNEWTYRSYIEGATRAAAIWNFEGLRREDFREGLPLNLTISVFRTHKGDIEKTVVGSYTLRNPATGRKSEGHNFFAKEFAIDEHLVPLKLKDADGAEIDLFNDLVDNGKLEIELVCIQGGQYFGMAQPDLYLLPSEASFEANFAKGYVSIWLQMVLLVALGVMWSTFLNGAVAMLATLATLVGGMFVPWMAELATGKVVGGGTFESFLRIVTQKSISGELEPTLTTNVVQWLDEAGRWPLKIISSLLPDFGAMSDTTYVADGYNIPAHVMIEQSLTTLGFIVPVFLIGLLCLKMREVAK